MPSGAAGRQGRPINIQRLSRHWRRIRPFCEDALRICDRWSAAPSRSGDDLALASTLRLVQTLEMVRSVDRLSRGELMPLLSETPMHAAAGQLSWTALIRMRDLVVHRPWDVDDSVVRRTIQQDFPILQRTAATTLILSVPQEDPRSVPAAALAETAEPQELRTIIYYFRSVRLRRLDL